MMLENVSLLRKNDPNIPRVPFFCIHPITGIGDQVYLPLARQLKDSRDFYAISSTNLANTIGVGSEAITLTKSINDLAHEYIRFIKKIQPKGPYCLGGFSFGGLVAFQMALILERPYNKGGLNEKVAFLGLFDTAFMDINAWDKPRLASYLVASLAALIEGYPALKVDTLQENALTTLDSKEEMIKAAFTQINMQPNDVDFNDLDKFGLAISQAKQLKEILKSSMHYMLAATKYQIAPEDKVKQITLFVATEPKPIKNAISSTIMNDEESIHHWKKHSQQPIRIVPIKANPFNIIENSELAEQLEKYLKAIDNAWMANNAVQQLIDILSPLKGQKGLVELFTEKFIQGSRHHPELAILQEAAQQYWELKVTDNNALRPAHQAQHIISDIPPHRRQQLYFNFGNNSQQQSKSSLTIHKLPDNDSYDIPNSPPRRDKVYF